MERRNFNRSEKASLFIAANGKCQLCGVSLEQGWHADHVYPYSKGGLTDVLNGQALCKQCNLKKGNTMQDTIKLRKWQEDLFERYERLSKRWFSFTATPGAGKTMAMLHIAAYQIKIKSADFIVCVVPSNTLKSQWKKKAASSYGLKFRANFMGYVTDEFDGVIVTYQQLSGKQGCDQVRSLGRGRKIFVIFDEPHHMADGLSWGKSAQYALDTPSVIGGILGTGTPFRSDDYAIPFVEYDRDGKMVLDYMYSYADGLADQVVRELYFRNIGTEATWFSYTSEVVTAGFNDNLNERQISERLSATISPGSEFVQAVLLQSYAELMDLRENDQHNAKMLIICKDRRHATEIGKRVDLLCQVTSIIVTSDEEHGGKTDITEFQESSAPIIIAVDMISEGVDIPNLRMLVYLTNKVAMLYFTQAVGRVVRVEKGRELANGYVYIPGDSRLLALAQTIKEERNHVIQENICPECNQWPCVCLPKEKNICSVCGQRPCVCPRDQLFMPIDATFEDNGGIYDAQHYNVGDIELARQWKQAHNLRIPDEEAAKIFRLHFAQQTAQAERHQPDLAIDEIDPETEQDRLKTISNKLAFRVGLLRDCHVKDIHLEWITEHFGKPQKQSSIVELNKKIEWLKKELSNG